MITGRNQKSEASRVDRTELLKRLAGASRSEALQAAVDASRSDDVRLVGPVLRQLKHGRRPFHREVAAYLLGFLGHRRVIPALERTLANRHENPKVRGQAAEALAYLVLLC